MKRALLFVLPLLAAMPFLATAGDRKVKDPGEIEKSLETVPFADKSMYPNLAQRLSNLGLKIERIDVGALTSEDVALSQGRYKRGDVDYRFYMNEPNDAVKALCPIWNTFTLTRRGSKWIPEDRTSNFLMSGYKCAPPK